MEKLNMISTTTETQDGNLKGEKRSSHPVAREYSDRVERKHAHQLSLQNIFVGKRKQTF